MFMDNYDYAANGQVDEFVSAPLNLQNATTAQLTFQVAYQLYTDPSTSPNYSDTLKVQISTDCGVTWNTAYNKYSTQLSSTTPAFSTTEFVPTASQWRMETVNLTPYLPVSNMLIRFRHITDYENNMYVDDINITSVVGTEEYGMKKDIEIFPNPTGGIFTIAALSGIGNQYSIEIYNLFGENIYSERINSDRAKVDLSNQQSGIYFLKVKTETESFTQKIIIQK